MKPHWTVAIVKDTTVPMLGLHGLHAAFRGLPGVEVAALVDSASTPPDGSMEVTGARRQYRDYRAMLDGEAPEIVVLCSRHPYDHAAQIQAAAERGIHVYCEKPMTVSLEEADRIVELADRRHIKIGMAHPARYGASFRAMKRMIDAGEIGTPLTAYGRGKSDHRGGGEDLMVLGTHMLDLMTFLFGPPESVWAEVMAEGRPVRQGDRCETVEPIGPTAGDHVFACFRFPEGVRGLFESRKGLFDPKTHATRMGLAVVGTEGTLSLRFDDVRDRPLRISRLPYPPDTDASYTDVPVEDDRAIPGAEPLDESLRGKRDIPRAPIFLEANRFAAWDLMGAIEEDRPPVSNARNARLALEMIYGIYASHLGQRAVPFPLADRRHPLDAS